MARARKQKRVVAIAPRKKSNKNKRVSKKEVGLLGQAIRALGATAGGAVGGLFGVPVAGAQTGNSLGAALSKWLGSGDYEVAQNSIVRSVRNSPGIPMMHNTSQSVVVRHKEYLGEVLSSMNFTVQGGYPLNPGVDRTFPWLSRIARRFQEYAFKGVVFHYVPTSGSISSTQALGSVMMQTTYRTTDDGPVSKVEMLNEYWACETVPADTVCHPIECDPKENPFNVHYVRAGEIPSGESKLSYDLGTMYIATSGQSANGIVLGDLWVTYEIELKKPVLTSNVTGTPDFISFKYNGGSMAALFNGTVLATEGTLGVTASGNIINFPLGTFGTFFIDILVYSSAGLTAPITWIADSTCVGCTLARPFADGGFIPTWGTDISAGSGIKYTSYRTAVEKTLSTSVGSITIPVGTVASGVITNVLLRVTRVD